MVGDSTFSVGEAQETPKPERNLLCFAAVFLIRTIMIETNPIHARISDLSARLASLRGYL